jgi:hypothetical protein
MGCTTCREKRMHKAISVKSRMLEQFIHASYVARLLKSYDVSYEYIRSAGVPFIKVCMCELNKEIMSELMKLKVDNKQLPVIYT